MSKKLITDESVNAYIERLKNIQKHKFSKKGDELFITKLVAESEQMSNLHVRAKVNDFEVESDEPQALGGTGNFPTPMESLLASLANCLEIACLLYFTFDRVNVTSVKVKVEAYYDKRAVLPDKEAPQPGFYDVNFTYIVESNEPEEKIKRTLERVENNCPVKGTFSRSHEYRNQLMLINSQD